MLFRVRLCSKTCFCWPTVAKLVEHPKNHRQLAIKLITYEYKWTVLQQVVQVTSLQAPKERFNFAGPVEAMNHLASPMISHFFLFGTPKTGPSSVSRPLNVRWVDTFHVGGAGEKGRIRKVSTSIGGRVWDPARSIPNSNINCGCNLYCKQRLLMLTVAFLCFHATFQNSSSNELPAFEHWRICQCLNCYMLKDDLYFWKFRLKLWVPKAFPAW